MSILTTVKDAAMNKRLAVGTNWDKPSKVLSVVATAGCWGTEHDPVLLPGAGMLTHPLIKSEKHNDGIILKAQRASLSQGVSEATEKLFTHNLGFPLVTQGFLVGQALLRRRAHPRRNHGVLKQYGRLGNADIVLFLKEREDSMLK